MRIFRATGIVMSVLCLMLCLCACGSEQNADTNPTGTTESTVPSTTPPTENTTLPTEPPIDTLRLYTGAQAFLAVQKDLVIEYQSTQNRTVGGEVYSESRTGTASYQGLGSGAFTALVVETFTCGSRSSQYIESYLNGSGWCRVSNSNFRSDMTAEDFLAKQLPALLLDMSLYANVTAEESSDGTVLYFDGATAAEDYLPTGAQLTAANGKLTLNAKGTVSGGSYHAEYTLAGIPYTLDVTTSVTMPENLDFSEQQPVYPEHTVVINDLSIPRYLLRAAGDVYASKNMTAIYTDRVTSQAFGQIRTQTCQYDTFGSGEGFIAALNSQVSITNYAGVTETTTQSAAFQNGQYSYSINGGDLTVDTTVTQEQIRMRWEDAILSALMMPNYIAGAQIEADGDLLYITFAGSNDFAETLCSNIYGLFGMDLDTFAESYTTEYASAYLTVNRNTLLPTAMGMGVSRSHVINGVTYQLVYQLDQVMELSSVSAYENITGKIIE